MQPVGASSANPSHRTEKALNDKVADQPDGTPRTSDLNHAIADAYYAHHAESVRFDIDHNADATRRYSAEIHCGGTRFYALGSPTPFDALSRAITLLKAAKGDGPLKVVDFAPVNLKTTEVTR